MTGTAQTHPGTAQTRQERTDHVNRVHQILEAVGIHLASVVSDIFGKSGQFILRSLLDGVTIEEIVERIPVARIKKKKEALLDALHTHLSPVDRVLLEQIWRSFM